MAFGSRRLGAPAQAQGYHREVRGGETFMACPTWEDAEGSWLDTFGG